MKSVSIIIPNFNGRELLEENIPVLIKQASSYKGDIEIIIVDDGSTDGSKEFISSLGGCKLIALEENFGFSYAVNRGVQEAKGDIVYLLNADVKVCAGFLEPLVEHFQDSRIFAVSSIEIKNSEYDSALLGVVVPLVKFKFGIFWYWYERVAAKSNPVEVFCVSGGHSAYDRQKFLRLGGFDTLFRPFYAEDGDICWRAWKNGFKSVIEPKSCVIHQRKATIGKFYPDYAVRNIHWKNRLLMTWKNLTSPYLFVKHIFFTIPELCICHFIGKREFSAGFFLALRQLPELIRARRKDKVEKVTYSDKTLFRRFSHPPIYPPYNILYLHETSQISGAENSLLNLVKNLDQANFKAVFVLPQDGPLPGELRKIGVKTVCLAFPKARYGIGVMATIKKLNSLIKSEEIRLIHSNSIRTHFYAAIAARLNSVPVIWHQRNLLTTEIIDPDRLFSFFADKIICNSQAIARRFLENGHLPKKVVVVYNGVDTRKFNPVVSGAKIREEFGIKPEDIVIGISSRFNILKGHEIFLKAAKEILQSLPEMKDRLRFMVVGGAVFNQDAQREKYLKDLVNKLGLNSNLIFSGFRTDMPEMYAAMDIAVLASAAEPCGRVILESMATAKPLIGTNSGGTPEIVQDGVTGYLFSPKDPAGLAEKIIFLINHKDIAAKIGRSGRSHIEANFTIETNAGKIQDIYLELIRQTYA